jgi:hypothetical protein
MMNKFRYIRKFGALLPFIFIAAISLITLTGCTLSTPETTPIPKGENVLSTANPGPNVTGETGSLDYRGEWTVKKVLAYGPAGTYSSGDAEKLVGLMLRFSSAEATIFSDHPSDSATVIKDPIYKESVITQDHFTQDFRMSFSQLGIEAQSVAMVGVSGLDDIGGCTLLLKDNNTIILVAGGTYFELTKK